MAYTTGSLIAQVRSALDEANREAVTDADDILPALNRGLDYAANIVARRYEQALVKPLSVTFDGSEAGYFSIPEDALEQRVERVELEYQTGYYRGLEAISFREVSGAESTADSWPAWWYVEGTRIRVLPNPTAGTKIRLWYAKDVDPLVEEQGRLLAQPSSGYLDVDEVGGSLSEESDELGSYFNVVDAQSGLIKGTFQIDYIEGQRIYVKSAPSLATVDNRTVLGSLAGLSIQANDFVCSYQGSCVPFMKKPLSNFLVQYAVAELTRKLGGDSGLEEGVLRRFEEQVSKLWSGREAAPKVKRSNAAWMNNRSTWGRLRR